MVEGNIIAYCNRPCSCTHLMNKEIIDNHNTCAQPEDTVYFLGDFCFGNANKYLDRLNGKFVLIQGNHDKKKTVNAFQERGFEVYRSLELKIGKYNCLLTHWPVYPKDAIDKYGTIKRTRDRLTQKHGNIDKKFDFFIVGHVHERWLWGWKSLNVGVDRNNFYPFHINEVEKFLYNKEREKK